MNPLPISLVLASLCCAATAQAQQADLYDEAVLRTIELTFKQTGWQTQLTANWSKKVYIKADMKIDGLNFPDVGVRYRGWSSYRNVSSIKKPFKISMDVFVADRELYGYSTLNLNNGYKDPTFCREVLAYKMLRRWQPASRANWVKLVVNGSNYGVYVNAEQINKDMLERWFEDKQGLRYRSRPIPPATVDDPALRYLGPTIQPYTYAYEIKNENPVNPWTNLIQTCNVLTNTPAAQMHTEIPKVLDIDECIRYIAGCILLPVGDSYIGFHAKNFYLYEDPWHRRTVLLPWDLNGAFNGLNGYKIDPFHKTTNLARPLLSRVIVESEWRQRYLAHMRSMMADVYDWKYVGPLITKWQKLISAEVQKDPVKIYSFTQFTDNVTKDLTSLGLAGLKPHIDKRRAHLQGLTWFKNVPPLLSNLGRSVAAPRDRDTVHVTARVTAGAGLAWVKLYWRARGPYTQVVMLDDGKHGDGAANDGVFGAAIPPQALGSRVDYYVGARSDLAKGGAMAFLPAAAGHLPPNYLIDELTSPGPILVNEVLADNENTDKDEKGDADDWVELHNSSASMVSLAGYTLSDDRKDPKKWTLPSGTTIPARGHLRIWLDNEPTEGPLHATFKLAKDGEEVALSDASGKLVDLFVFGKQAVDRSYGRLPDAGRSRFHLFRPTALGPWNGLGEGLPQAFDVRHGGAPSGLRLESTSMPKEGYVLKLEISGAPKLGTAILGISLGQQTFDLGGFGPLLIDTNLMVTVRMTVDAFGKSSFAATIPQGVAGFTVYTQVAATELSNGLAVRFAK